MKTKIVIILSVESALNLQEIISGISHGIDTEGLSDGVEGTVTVDSIKEVKKPEKDFTKKQRNLIEKVLVLPDMKDAKEQIDRIKYAFTKEPAILIENILGVSVCDLCEGKYTAKSFLFELNIK